jgi:hypothetical protein
MPETEPTISGQVVSGEFLQNAGEGFTVIMSVASGAQRTYDATSTAVVNGRFRLPYNEHPNGVSYILQLVPPPNPLFRADMKLDTAVYPASGIRLPYRLDMNRADVEIRAKNTVQPYTADDDLWKLYIPEVVISAARAKGIHPLSPGRIKDRKITSTELKILEKKTRTLEDVFRSIPDVTLRQITGGGTKDLVTLYNYGMRYYTFRIVVDGIWYYEYTAPDYTEGMSRVLAIPVEMLEEIEIVKAPAPEITLEGYMGLTVNKNWGDWTHFGNYGTILITTKARNGGINRGNRQFKVSPLGYQVNRAFYSPAYETPEQQNAATPDLRSTIYWNPDVRTNEDGNAEINFHAADPETSYTVTIEGITKEGIPVRKTEKIKRSDP